MWGVSRASLVAMLTAVLTVTAWRRRSAVRWAAAAGTAAAETAAVFSGFMPLPWPGHPADAALMAASDLYILAGLGVLAATGVALTRRRADAMKPDF
jgi:hypothetical protein